jgi:sugar phosphate permease
MSNTVATAEVRAMEMTTLDEDKSDTVSLEKEDINRAEAAYRSPALSTEDAEWLANIDQKEQHRIFHKVDLRLVPMLALLYLIAHLDRANIGNAKIEGLEDSLNMNDTDYNVAVAVFFVPYVLCEVPSNLLLAKFSRPSYYMGTLVTCWGVVMTCTGVVQSFGGLVGTRFLLGLFE